MGKQKLKAVKGVNIHKTSGKEYVIDGDSDYPMTQERMTGPEYKSHWESAYAPAKIDYVGGYGCTCDWCNELSGPDDDVYHQRINGNDYQTLCVKCGDKYVKMSKDSGKYKLVA